MNIFQTPITKNSFTAIRTKRQRALISNIDPTSIEVGDIMLAQPYDFDSKRFLKFDEFSQKYDYLSHVDTQPLSSQGLLLEVSYVDILNTSQVVLSFNIVTHHMKKTVILASFESRKTDR